MPETIRVLRSMEQARTEILGRRATSTLELPETVRAGVRAVFGRDLTATEVVARIVADVRSDGDAAVRRYTRAFDGVDPGDPVVPEEDIAGAMANISPELRDALQLAHDRIKRFHERSRRSSWLDFAEGGALGQMMVPIQRVGIYAPGGRAAYPSTVLMAAVPARVAGVSEVVLATPPDRDGSLNPAILAAARIAGVDRVYRMGGAQAIAALAYGTDHVAAVDKIVGPGNVFVVLAKQMVAGTVGIDGLPGPTETVVIADGTANPAWLVADMLAQAEHDPLAQAILVCVGDELLHQIIPELERQLAATPRQELIRGSLKARGAVVVAASLDEALDFANLHAPEHLCLSVADPWSCLGRVRSAGGVFVGERSVEAVGDYTAGPSHIMPTGGTARFASPLSVDDFTKIVSVFSFSAAQLRQIAPAAIEIARAEGLEAHAAAIEARLRSGST